MGFPKALLPLGNRIFLTRILDTLQEAGLANPIVVLGRDAQHIEPRIADRTLSILINHDSDRGQLSSIQLAIRHLEPQAGGCLVWPVDQPAVSAELVRNLVELYRSSGAWLVFPFCGEEKGHPVIFHRSLFRELLEAPLESGARSVVVRHQAETAILPTAETATVRDIDTPEDYFNLTGDMLDAARLTDGKRGRSRRPRRSGRVVL